jgi:arsenate reductase (glutaredoxin)
MKLYGIPNCDTVKKARAWLTSHHIEVEFHDFKKSGLKPELAQCWLQQMSWEQLINRKGLTWRGLDEAQKSSISNNDAAQNLMMEKTSVIKRPLLENNGILLHIGFDEAAYRKLFNL